MKNKIKLTPMKILAILILYLTLCYALFQYDSISFGVGCGCMTLLFTLEDIYTNKE